MLLHVDNLRRSYEREHTELEETKRVLIEHKLLVVRNHLLILTERQILQHTNWLKPLVSRPLSSV